MFVIKTYFIRYYIDEGEIELIEENSKKVLATIKKGETIGEYSFFTGL